MAGKISSDSIIWVVGEHDGINSVTGEAIAVSGWVVAEDTKDTADLAASKAYTDALHAKLTASGILP